MVSLLAWRSTCRDNYFRVADELRRSLNTLVARFFSDPLAFLDILNPWSALIVGEAALSHVLHEPSICNATFEIAVGNLYFEPFVDSIARLLPHDLHLTTYARKPSPDGFAFHRHVTRIAEFHLSAGLVVAMYESSSPSACDVVAGYWTMALMNFVTAYTFGCAYPRLTLNDCAILCDSRVLSLSWSDRDLAHRMRLYGFEFDHRFSHWPLPARGPSSSSAYPHIKGCGDTLYVCPHQARFFGDPGSLVVFYEGLASGLDALRDQSVAPYCLMVAWRVPVTGSCTGGCLNRYRVLPPFVVSMLSQYAEDTSVVPRSVDVVCTISDAAGRFTIISPCVPASRRRYSM